MVVAGAGEKRSKEQAPCSLCSILFKHVVQRDHVWLLARRRGRVPLVGRKWRRLGGGGEAVPLSPGGRDVVQHSQTNVR